MRAVMYTLLGAVLAGCIQTPPLRSTQKKGPQLVEMDGVLFAVEVPEGYRRGSLFYVLDSVPIPGSISHQRIALVEAIEPQGQKGGVFRVAWYCSPTWGTSLPTGPLSLEGVQPDALVSVGKCWGEYEPNDPAMCHGPIFDLSLRLGKGVGVRHGDVFEVLGAAHVDPINRTVLDFARVGICTVQPTGLSIFGALCRLDSRAPGSQHFNRWACERGGFVHIAPPHQTP